MSHEPTPKPRKLLAVMTLLLFPVGFIGAAIVGLVNHHPNREELPYRIAGAIFALLYLLLCGYTANKRTPFHAIAALLGVALTAYGFFVGWHFNYT